MYKDLEFSVRADGWEKKSVFKGYWGDDSSVQVVMNMQMDKVEDYKEEEQVTREVAKMDKDMIGSRILGQI